MRRPPESQLVLVETAPFARGPGKVPKSRVARAPRPASLPLPLAPPRALEGAGDDEDPPHDLRASAARQT